KVQENALLAFLKQTPDGRAQSDTAFTNRDLSAHVENGNISSLTLLDIQLSHCQKSPLCNCELTSLEHAHCCTTFGSDQPVNLVHKRAHEKDAAARSLQDVLGRCWVWNVFWIEPWALVMDADFHSVRRAFQNDINGFVFVLTIAVNDGVGNCLAHGHVD